MTLSPPRAAIAAVLAGFTQACSGATTGAVIPIYPNPRTAVLAVDLQRDFLADDARLPVARAQVEPLVRASNAVLDAARERGVRVIYIGNEFSESDFIANLFRRHAAMRGSPGVELDPRVHRVSDVYFPKSARDAFTNPDIDAYLRREQIGQLVVFGVMGDACVRATVLGARNRGYAVTLVRDAVGTRDEDARDGVVAQLAEAGVRIATVAEAIEALEK
jgi:maleamate amidohydrolase